MQHDTLSLSIPFQAPSPSSEDITPIPASPLFTDLTPPTTNFDTNSCTNRPLTPPNDHPPVYVTPRSRHQRSKSGQQLHHRHYHHHQHPQRPESEVFGGHHPRPNSFTSVYQTQLSKKSSFRRTKNDQKGDGEFNDSFERVRSLLTTLISDASTAVGGSSTTVNTISVKTEFEGSESGESGLEENDGQDVIEHVVDNNYNIDNSSNSNCDNNNNEQCVFKDEDEDENSLLDATVYGNENERGYGARGSRRHWTRKRAYMDEPSKRTSLFLELQNFQLKQETTDPAASADDRSFVTEAGAEADTEAEADVDADAALADDTLCEDCESSILSGGEIGDELLGHIVGCADDQTWLSDSWDDSDMESSPVLSPRHCASFPPWRSDHAELQLHTEELQQVIQRLDTELDRTAGTIDGLTRDLMTVATHQSWLQMTLERTLQFHPMVEDAAFAYFEDGFEAMDQDSSCASPPSPFSKQQHRLPAPKGLSEYIQALKGVVAMGQGLGLDSFHLEGAFLPPSDGYMDHLEDLQDESDMLSMQRFSGSSYTLTNGSCRNSATSTFSLETRFDDTPEFSQKAIENDDATVFPCSQDTPFPTGNNDHFDSESTDQELQDELSQDARQAGLTMINTPATTTADAFSSSTDRKLQETLVLLDWPSPPSSAPRDQDLDAVMKQHHALLLKTTVFITRWVTTNTHLILLVVSSVVFIVGTIFMDPLATRETGQKLVQRIETIRQLLEHVDGHDDIKATEEVVDDGELEMVPTPVL